MDLGEAVYREITGGRSPHTEINTFGGAVEYLLIAAGGVAARAARLVGVPASTFRGWIRGRQPKAERAGAFVAAAQRQQRRDRLPRGRERRLRRNRLDGVRVTGTYLYAAGGPAAYATDRDIGLGRYLDDVTDELLDAYLDGAEPSQLGEILAEAINDRGFYEQTFDPDNPAGGWDISSFEGWA